MERMNKLMQSKYWLVVYVGSLKRHCLVFERICTVKVPPLNNISWKLKIGDNEKETGEQTETAKGMQS